MVIAVTSELRRDGSCLPRSRSAMPVLVNEISPAAHSRPAPVRPVPSVPPALSVVVPVHDEADNVGPLIDEIRAALEGLAPFEVVVVDDGSDDATPRRLAALRARHPWLRALRHTCNAGQSTALATAVRAARAPLIVTLDGDGQNDPADIPGLLRRWRLESAGPGPLLLVGWRTRRRDTRLRRLSSRVANAVRGRLLGDRTPDTGCGLKLFDRATFLALPYFDHMHRFLPALVLRHGGRVVSVPVQHRPRQRGRSHYGVLDRLGVGLVDLAGVMWLRRRARVPAIEPIEPAEEG
jgi:dolichol-phosphate mannosyltransferase